MFQNIKLSILHISVLDATEHCFDASPCQYGSTAPVFLNSKCEGMH